MTDDTDLMERAGDTVILNIPTRLSARLPDLWTGYFTVLMFAKKADRLLYCRADGMRIRTRGRDRLRAAKLRRRAQGHSRVRQTSSNGFHLPPVHFQAIKPMLLMSLTSPGRKCNIENIVAKIFVNFVAHNSDRA